MLFFLGSFVVISGHGLKSSLSLFISAEDMPFNFYHMLTVFFCVKDLYKKMVQHLSYLVQSLQRTNVLETQIWHLPQVSHSSELIPNKEKAQKPHMKTDRCHGQIFLKEEGPRNYRHGLKRHYWSKIGYRTGTSPKYAGMRDVWIKWVSLKCSKQKKVRQRNSVDKQK